MTAAPVMIGIDWGTSNFRAWLMDADARPIDAVTSTEGLLKVPSRDFPAALRRACGKWLDRWPALPILMCGMIGSRHGWREAAYLRGDAGAVDLAGATLAIEPSLWDVRIVPGLQSKSYAGAPDVMRGEETQLVGALALGAPKNALVCLPGTHSKWVELREGRIRSVTTFLTGELFALLRDASILTGLIKAEGEVSGEAGNRAFRAGLKQGCSRGVLTHKLFSIRARALTGSQTGATAEMLSGLLIGTELGTLRSRLAGRDVAVIGSGALATRYRTALAELRIDALTLDGDEACRAGLAAIAREVPDWRIPA